MKIICFSILLLSVTALQGQDPRAHKVDFLIKEMTLREKIGQLNQYSVGVEMTGPEAKQGQSKIRYERLMNGEVGSVLNLLGAENTYKLQKQVVENSRLGIPLLFSYDVIHGYKTIFPIPLGEAASWDLKLMEKSAGVAAKEAASAGLHWTFAPMIDVSRDARWGRVMEGAGEDPYLGAEIARARIRGFQGDDLASELTIAACAKHFAGYGFVESGKDYNNVYAGNVMLFNTILPPFEAAVEEGVATFMNAFNDIDGVPSTSNAFLLRDILRDRWEFEGPVVSDWNSIGELVNHGVAADKNEAAGLAIRAGTDMDMEGDAFIQHLESLVKSGQVDEKVIDDAVRRVLGLKYDLGLFDDPYRYSDPEREKRTLLNDEHREIARDVARKSIVLLKNENNLLPLEKAKRIALIGPLAKDKDAALANWRAQGTRNSAVSVFEGLSAAFDERVEMSFAEGVKLSIGPNNFFAPLQIEMEDTSGFAAAVDIASKADVVVMVLGEPAYMSGEARSRSEIGLPGLQPELLRAVYQANKNMVLVVMSGRPLTLSWEAEYIPAIMEAWHLGTESGNAIADVLTGTYNPSGKLPMSFPRSVGQLPIYYNYKNTGRPESDAIFFTHHMDVDRSPLYAFGYGLSYTTFKYENLQLTPGDSGVLVTVDVSNTGARAGEEVAQLYIRDLNASITRPVRELKSFEKFFLKPGETTTIRFVLIKSALSFYDKSGKLNFEPGRFQVWVGGDSNAKLTAHFEL